MERPTHPSGYLRSGVYAKTPATLEQIFEAVISFLSQHGEQVEDAEGVLDDGRYKTDGLLGVAIHGPAAGASGEFVGLVDSTPRDGQWLPVFARHLHQKLGVDVFVYWTGVPKQSLGEARWYLTNGAAKKTASWKKIVADVEGLPSPYVRFADLAKQPEPAWKQVIFRMDRKAFEHALEFNKKSL